MNMPDHDVRVDYDDQPNDVADKFVAALEKLGVIVDDVTPVKSELPYLFYKITLPTNEKA